MTRAGILSVVPALLLAGGASGQQPTTEGTTAPRAVAERIVTFFNNSTTLRMRGRAGVPTGSTVVSDVAAHGGPFTVAGLLDGNLVVLNGDLEINEGALVTGDVTVVGGDVSGATDAAIGGTLTVYSDVLRVVEREGIVALSSRQLRELGQAEGLGRSRISVRSGTSYNRVEGLPVMIGPVVETAEPNSLMAEALLVWRTESGFSLDQDRIGYSVLLEQRFGPEHAVSLGGTVHSIVVPVNAGGLTDLESSLATFFLHRDYRDYFERRGWTAFARTRVPGTPLALRVEYADERHAFLPVASPWTLRRNDAPWRPQPFIAEGEVRALTGEIEMDTRNDPDDPTDGWWIRARATRGLEGDLAVREHLADDPIVPPLRFAERPVNMDFAVGVLDARRYARVGPDADVAFRAMLAGSLDERGLAPQFQHALGGEGTLPGYGLFSLDCGARREVFLTEVRTEGGVVREPGFPSYGCDRVALFGFEFRQRFGGNVRLGPDRAEDWYPQLDLSPSWAFFVDVGKGWSLSGTGPDTEWLSDVGVGIFLWDVGLYVARPLGGERRDFNFFIRFDRRF